MARVPRWDDPWRKFPASKPLPAAGGIASSKARGAMASTWWSKRFVDVLESFGLGGRMTRGRTYARAGQVVSLDVRDGLVVAQVQGSRRLPYAVTVALRTPTASQWARIEVLLRGRAAYAAAMLAGEVPHDLEALFGEAGCRLFPAQWRDLRATCSCPDWGDPCKHQAAVLYVFADQLDADPWRLLEWHGRTKQQVLALFATGAGAGAPRAGTGASDAVPAVAPWWPLLPGAASTAAASPADASGAVPPPTVVLPDAPGAVLGRLAPSGIVLRDGRTLEDVLAALYRDAPDGAA